MTQDIGRFGAGALAYAWVKSAGGYIGGREMAGSLILVAISDTGEVTDTSMRRPWDEAAPTRAEAVRDHLAGAISAADAHLERQRADRGEPDEKPKPVDPATEWFYRDAD